MPQPSEQQSYWEERLHGGPSLATVGWLGLGGAYNAWMYRVRAARFMQRVRACLQREHMPAESLRVLDVGSGTGFYLNLWRRLGARNRSGADLTQAAVTALRCAYPGVTVEQMDIGGEELPFAEESFDAVSCMDVLFHIVDDARYAAALKNCARLLRPGGLLFFTDNYLHGPALRAPRQVSRSAAEIDCALANAGLRLLERSPVFVLMNAPVDSSSVWLRRWWRVLRAVAGSHEILGFAAGALVYPFELALAASAREGPSTEMLICRRSA